MAPALAEDARTLSNGANHRHWPKTVLPHPTPRHNRVSLMSRLPHDHISVTNVRPAYQASLHAGVAQAELDAVGLTRATMDDDEASLPAAATYAHLELMERRGGLDDFMVDAARRHTIASLGIVGLACKTVPTVGVALRCHQRFQHLTNRTARYSPETIGGRLELREQREGDPRRGSVLVSDYTMLIAVHLLRTIAAAPLPVLEARSKRVEMGDTERASLESFIGAPLVLGSAEAALCLHADVLDLPVASADAELAAYFQDVLSRAARFDPEEPALVTETRTAIQEALATGTPTGVEIGKRMGMSQRTLQRRLLAHGLGYQALVDDTRARLSLGYLADPKLSLAEVAYLLGYREETSFFRSFRRWKGVTPTEWRAGVSSRDSPRRRAN
jgi:AraC-like DNA-binding protein